MRVLVVEDDPMIRQMLAEHLRRHGYDVSQAAGVQEAIDSLRASPPDIVVSDVEMGDGTVVQLVDDISQCATVPPVILVTGGAGDLARQLLDDGRVWAVLAKPFALSFLTTLVETHKAGGSQSAPAESKRTSQSSARGLSGPSSGAEPRRAPRASGSA